MNARDANRIHESAFIHTAAVVIGNVTLGARASVWPTAVIRGDGDSITVGDESNVQDGAVLHVDPGLPVYVGNRVTIGHRAIVHGATIEDDCLIGMGAIVLNGARIGKGSVIGAGIVVPAPALPTAPSRSPLRYAALNAASIIGDRRSCIQAIVRPTPRHREATVPPRWRIKSEVVRSS